MNRTFIEMREYERFAEFCDTYIKYKYIGICYGAPGVSRTLSSRYYCNWDNTEEQIAQHRADDIGKNATDGTLGVSKVLYTAPIEKMSCVSSDISTITSRIGLTKAVHIILKYNQEDPSVPETYEAIDLIIVDEINRLRLQHLEQLRDIYNKNDPAMVPIGMPDIEKRLFRYLQLYYRIGFAYEFDSLSRDEARHILEHKWSDLGIDIRLEDFSDYEAITTTIKITKGDFKLIHHLFAQIGRISRINRIGEITMEVVEATRDSLVISV